MDTGKKIQIARKKAGKTQAQLGQLLGVSGAMVGQWENNQRNPKPDTLLRIAEALQVSVADLWDDDNEDSLYIFRAHKDIVKSIQNSMALEFAESVYARDIISAFKFLNEQGQEEAATRVYELAQIPKYQRKPPQKPPTDADPNTDTPE